MRSKDYLQQAYVIEKKIKLDLQKLEAAKASLHGRAINYDRIGTRSSAGGGPEEAIVRVVDYEDHINSEIERLSAVRSEIESRINSISGDVLREVLIRRYLMYQKWELIAEEMNYGVRHIYKLHAKALEEFSGMVLPKLPEVSCDISSKTA